MENILDNNPNELYIRFMRQYDNLHRCCPKCGSYKYEATLLGYIFDEEHPEAYKNKNQCTCLNCGWKGIYDERVPDIKLYPGPYYIHKKTGNRYCKVTDKDNFMFKENGEWKRGLVLYKTMYWNPDGEYFARTKEDFENNFIEENLVK